MPIVYHHHGFDAPANISRFIACAERGGSLPRLTGSSTRIYQSRWGEQAIDGSGGAIMAFPLITCASVIFASTSENHAPVACLYHALSGSVGPEIVPEALRRLGNPPLSSVVAVYAINKPLDDDYMKDAAKIVTAGIPDRNVVMVPSAGGQFGINSYGQIGCS